MKKKYIVVIGVVAAIAIAAIGGTLASGYVQAKEKLNVSISEKSLGVAIVDEKNVAVKEDSVGTDIVPGGKIDLDRSITNSKEDGYDIYARVSIFYDWDKVKNSDAYKDKVFGLSLNGEDLIINASYEESVKNGDWIIVESTPGEIIMYYTRPIKSSEKVPFLEQLSFDTEMGNEYAGATLSLEYEVNAVQASAKDSSISEKAIASEWGVYVTIEEQTIVSVSETRTVEE